MSQIELFFPIFILLVLGYAAVKDGQDRQIPNRVSLSLILLGVIGVLLISNNSVLYISIQERTIGFLIPAFLLFMLYHFKGGIGGGDIKLVSSLGLCVGLPAVAFILIISTISGTIYARIKRQGSIPFAPFVFVGALCYAGLPIWYYFSTM